mmetsp:Transcript_10317/g.36029  ORF Transcript_10317/g.36029 Transcript_10317/m.36029 type:complete len:366 (+) Transcript_10317:1987-3084(+)
MLAASGVSNDPTPDAVKYASSRMASALPRDAADSSTCRARTTSRETPSVLSQHTDSPSANRFSGNKSSLDRSIMAGMWPAAAAVSSRSSATTASDVQSSRICAASAVICAASAALCLGTPPRDDDAGVNMDSPTAARPAAHCSAIRAASVAGAKPRHMSRTSLVIPGASQSRAPLAEKAPSPRWYSARTAARLSGWPYTRKSEISPLMPGNVGSFPNSQSASLASTTCLYDSSVSREPSTKKAYRNCTLSSTSSVPAASSSSLSSGTSRSRGRTLPLASTAASSGSSLPSVALGSLLRSSASRSRTYVSFVNEKATWTQRRSGISPSESRPASSLVAMLARSKRRPESCDSHADGVRCPPAPLPL